MALKDYYSILEVAPNSGSADIKKAYRRLAMIHHPDRNKENPYAAAYFDEIREAYETLSDPLRKDHYLQQRWYQQSLGKNFTSLKALTPETILNDCIHLKKYVQSLNAFRIDKRGLANYINILISSDTIQTLKVFNDREVNLQICNILLDAVDALDLVDLRSINDKLVELSADSSSVQKIIDQKISSKKSIERYRSYEMTIILLITALICISIWFAAK